MNKSKFFLTLSAMFLLAGCTTNTQSSTAPGSAGDSSGQPVSSSTAGGVTYNKTNELRTENYLPDLKERL